MNSQKEILVQYCLRLADSPLVLGQRMAEWCSNGPLLEEDIAMTNISLDLFGQARAMYDYIVSIEQNGKTEDDYAFLRNEREYYNNLLAERPNGDFGQTVMRNFFYSAFYYHFFKKLAESKDERLSAHAQKSLKETTYHLRHSAEWVVRLGDGTEESHQRIQSSANDLWAYTGDLFEMNEIDQQLIEKGIAVDLNTIKPLWKSTIEEVFSRATLSVPVDGYMHSGRLEARHSEYLGHLLSEMQYLQRSYPDAKW
jgi:ring-1,2-phenylacetyl-CoA epoxidase subunit PaaC